MKKRMFIVCALVMALLMVGCSSTPKDSEPTTIGTKLEKVFNDTVKDGGDLTKIATELSTSSITEMDLAVETIYPGNPEYLNGFDASITKFTEGRVIQPWIGSIPFVCYVFETDDVDALKEELNANANPRWNICTEADETVVAVNGNYVYFIMCSNEE